ncbi:HotDog domain-containing protein [Nemania sp. FL0916]|nr:HotDog domain-containing protein [Nemania sp. FL0916]
MVAEAQAGTPLNDHVQYFISQGIDILQRPSTVSFLPASRRERDPEDKTALVSRDRMFRNLLNTERAIPRLIGLHENPFRDINPTSTSARFPDLPFIVNSITLVLEVREDLHGFNATVNGGAICAIIDEAMGSILTQNDVLNREAKVKGYIPTSIPNIAAAATASMDVKYLKPVPTPSVVLATATLTRLGRRSISMRVVVANKDGREYARADGSFVSFPTKAKI